MNFLIALIIGPLMALEIPGQLSGSDRTRSLEILGLNTSTKHLSQAYPFGGYSGFEISLAVEAIDTSELSSLGDGMSSTQNLYLPTLTIGKGLYNDIEFFFHFLPTADGTSKYGGSLRWSFLKLLYLPINFSIVAQAGSANFKNQLVTRNIGSDLLIGVSLGELSFFTGGGYVNSRGTFFGGTGGITASNATEDLKIDSTHFVMGATYNFNPFFIGLSIDRYTDVVYSFKSGFFF